jgi:hypothetical protein
MQSFEPHAVTDRQAVSGAIPVTGRGACFADERGALETVAEQARHARETFAFFRGFAASRRCRDRTPEETPAPRQGEYNKGCMPMRRKIGKTNADLYLTSYFDSPYPASIVECPECFIAADKTAHYRA